jgi:hypothetical protein
LHLLEQLSNVQFKASSRVFKGTSHFALIVDREFVDLKIAFSDIFARSGWLRIL